VAAWSRATSLARRGRANRTPCQRIALHDTCSPRKRHSRMTDQPTLETKEAPPRLVRTIGSTALAKILVMGLSGLLGIINSRLIIQHFGVDAYTQFGLLTSLPALLPFADLGIGAVVVNAVAGSSSAKSDVYARRAIVTAVRILMISGGVILAIAGIITLLGLWPTLLGAGLMKSGGSLAAFLCLAIFGLALPLTVGQRILVGLRKTTVQVASQAVVAPFLLLCVISVIALALPAASWVPIFSFLANAVGSIVCLVVAGRALRPQFGIAAREIFHPKLAPSVPSLAVAWPMLAQMLALPIAMQTDRLLLSHLTRGTQLAQYNLASQLFGIVLSTIFAAGVAFWPIYARARAAKRIESPLKPTMWFFLGGLAFALVLAVLSPFLAGYISSGKIVLDPWLIGGFIVFVAFQAAKYPIGMYMTDARGLKFQIVPILIMVPLNLGISWWLIGVVGAGGPIIGSAVSVLLCQIIPNFLYVRRDLAARRLEAQIDSAPPVA
jgi:O-antigen/teichoic acid export membrane protein